jgi:addiction module HigA family antidote
MSWTYPEHHPGEYLQRRFLEPLGISASELARATHIPRSRISEILSGKRGITADTALRLGRFLRMEPEFWLSLQGSWELAQLEEPSIVPASTRGWLVGPAGAVALPERAPVPPPTARMSSELLARLRASAARAPEEGPRELVHVQYDSGQHAWVSKLR